MAKKYVYRLTEYELSKNRVCELMAFCRQYDEKKQKLSDLYLLSSPPFEAPVQGGVNGNPTEKKALKAARLQEDIELIEKCADEAGEHEPNIVKPLMKAVTQGLSYYKVGITYEDKNSFYLRRRRFFWLLDQASKVE